MCSSLRIFLLGILCIVIIAITVGCAGSAMQFVEQDYVGQNRFSTSILAMPLSTEFLDGTVLDSLIYQQPFEVLELTPYEVSFFNRLLPLSFEQLTTAKIMGIDATYHPDLPFDYKAVTPNDKTYLYMFVPKGGSVTYHNVKPEFLLFFEDLYFQKTYEESASGLGQSAIGKYYLEVGLEYLIYDNLLEKVAGFGQVKKNYSLLDVPTQMNYSIALEEIAEEIIDHSPFVKRFVDPY